MTALVDRVRDRLVAGQREATPAHVTAALRAEGLVLGDDAVLDLVRDLRHELVGMGPLEPLLRTPRITDVLVNGPHSVWIDRGQGMEPAAVRFAGESEVRRLAQRLASTAGRRLDDASPCVDARLPSGVRLHAVIPPLSSDGTLISLRIPSRIALTLADLVAGGTLDDATAELLAAIVRQRLAFLISGGTGSGKTTILAALLGRVPAGERLVIVEDSTELSPQHDHVVRLQSRMANVEGAGAVPMRDLVRQALRMRPDRLIVGEVRGAEVVDLLAAMNTGHEGGAGTVHANSAADVPARLEALGLMAGLDRTAVHALVAAGVDAVIHVARGHDGVRAVSGVHVLERQTSGVVTTLPALVRCQGRSERGPGWEALQARISDA